MTGRINEDYFKASQKSDTPIADSLARYANEKFKEMGLDDTVDTKPEVKKEADAPKNPFDKGFVI